MKTFLFIAFMAFLFAGCAKVVPAVSEYRLNSTLYDTHLSSQSCKDKSLKVAQSFSPGVLTNLDIMYGVGEHKQFRYTQSKWVQSPNAAVTSEIVNFLKSSNLFSSVNVPKSRAKTDYVLEANIEDFMQYFTEDEKSSFVKASITFTLLDTKKNSVVSTKNFKITIPVKTLDAEGGIVALNEALKELLPQSGIWLNEICR
jgi:cholesterol transport system auxiliary component